LICFMLVGAWLAHIRMKSTSLTNVNIGQWMFLTPVALVTVGLFVGPTLFAFIPPVGYLIFGLLPLLASYASHRMTSKKEGLAVVFSLLTYFVIQDIMLTTALVCCIFAMQYAEYMQKWGWATAGVAVSISAAWSNMISIYQAAIMLFFFMHPWLIVQSSSDNSSNKIDMFKPRFALWGSVVIAGIYLILTWVILLSSIDVVSFETHELYGAPFLFALGCSFYLYMGRHLDRKTMMIGLSSVVVFSMMGLFFAPHAWGFDSDHSISEIVSRGHLAWVVLPMTLVAAPFVIHELVIEAKNRRQRGKRLNSISFKAHMTHLGLLLLIIGHIFTTTLVDRGDATHRVTLIRDEVVVYEGYGYMFTDVELTSDDLEVGDGLVTLSIEIYSIDDGKIGEKLTTLQPGVLRFDSTMFPRSEVDTYSRLTGDTVVIFDGTQASSLMQSVSTDGTESVELIRVTVYTLHGSHLVWVGWVLMLIGMLSLAAPTFRKTDEEEE